MIQRIFIKTRIATSLSLILGATALPAMSAEAANIKEEQVEVIEVTGMRSSIKESTRMKRDASGVVDAISAEDIGKFPDTNLAESLQRITGVSISRENGEGKSVTVRGFGGGNNMVTLNGRQMPTADVFGGGGNGSSGPGASSNAKRAFDFGNLASDSIKSVEVYKTGRANLATGGIGATININTLKPLDSEGLVASFGAKAIFDTTNKEGDDITPELSGLISFTDDDSVFGVALTFNHSERHSGAEQVTVNGWNIGTWGTDDLYQLGDNSNAVITNAPADGDLYARPDDIRYSTVSTERVRDNAQLTLQYAMSDSLIGTLDYTYANNDIQQRRTEATSWISLGGITEIEFDSNATIKSPIFVNTPANTAASLGQDQQYMAQENTLSSIGVNVAWEATDRLSVNFDVHSSSAESMPNGHKGAGQTAIQIAANTGTGQSYRYDGDIPTQTLLRPDGLTAEMHSSQIGHIRYADQTTDIDQAKIDFTYEFDDGQIDFGLETRTMEMRTRNSSKQLSLGGWGASTPGDIPSELLSAYDPSTFDNTPSGAASEAMKGNAEDILEAVLANTDQPYSGQGLTADIETNWNADNQLEEDTNALYFQITVNGELGGMETNFTAGLRYEETDLRSTSYLRRFQGWQWQGNNDDRAIYGNDIETIATNFDYSNFLPSFDFDIHLTDELIGRFSFSETISRASYGNLQSDTSGFNFAGGSTYNGLTKTASENNPELLPLQSSNYDISLEWYFDDTSYVSAGFFEKRVKNFIGQSSSTKNVWGVRDQTNGPRVAEAVAELANNGINTNDSNIYTAMVMLAYPEEYPGGFDSFIQQGEPGYDQSITDAEVIAKDNNQFYANADDPLTDFLVSKPLNNKEARIYGAEFAVQHFFGESGFGFQANYTIVKGDIGFDNGAEPGANQFALLGLSDTANLVGMYEKDGLSARIAYNWRDDYLRSTSRSAANNPIYVEAYSQIDINVSYQINDHLAVFAEALNITEEDRRDHGRSHRQIEFYEDLGARYQIGARYNF
ncbi:MAG: TonB-dependent receptor [Colwellia sp.]|nr:TonB-dependent receptor [Colwellia sp.]